ncbi:MAG TPA: porin [Steroidobacteraceae bacterium]|nr:porin [Steroidobacteraceae bacterium]
MTSRTPLQSARSTPALATAAAASLLGTLSGVAQAQTVPADDALTMHGVTLYGIVDIGLQCDSHGAPFNDYFPAGSNDIVQKDSNHGVCGATPSNLSQSRVGLQGKEPLMGDWSAVFRLETFFNPQSGEISDALRSLVQNNGRSAKEQTVNLDSSVAGQAFQQSYVGVSSPSFGTLTFGRQNTLLADAIAKYDPQAASQAFALIGLSGTTAGAGDTQDRRLDSSLKYSLNSTNGLHAGAMYKFNGSTGAANTAFEGQLGGEFAGFSVDGYYVHVRDAIAASALSATQLSTLAAGFSPSNSLSGTVSDNTSFTIAGDYKLGVVTLYAAYEHIKFANPDTPLDAGFDDIGGYKLAFVNNTAFPHDKILQVFWAGVKFNPTPMIELNAAYYGYKQNSFAGGANTGCSDTRNAGCSGTENAVSFSAVYKATKRFDLYAGAMWTDVTNGLASGFDFSRSNIDPTIGVRFKF